MRDGIVPPKYCRQIIMRVDTGTQIFVTSCTCSLCCVLLVKRSMCRVRGYYCCCSCVRDLRGIVTGVLSGSTRLACSMYSAPCVVVYRVSCASVQFAALNVQGRDAGWAGAHGNPVCVFSKRVLSWAGCVFHPIFQSQELSYYFPSRVLYHSIEQHLMSTLGMHNQQQQSVPGTTYASNTTVLGLGSASAAALAVSAVSAVYPDPGAPIHF